MILSGHTHNGCLRRHKHKILKSKTQNSSTNDPAMPQMTDIYELSIASFNWRNRDNPVFVLMSMTEDYILLTKNFGVSQKFTILRDCILFGLITYLASNTKVLKFFQKFFKFSLNRVVLANKSD